MLGTHETSSCTMLGQILACLFLLKHTQTAIDHVCSMSDAPSPTERDLQEGLAEIPHLISCLQHAHSTM